MEVLEEKLQRAKCRKILPISEGHTYSKNRKCLREKYAYIKVATCPINICSINTDKD
jgi:hypothetical protein